MRPERAPPGRPPSGPYGPCRPCPVDSERRSARCAFASDAGSPPGSFAARKPAKQGSRRTSGHKQQGRGPRGKGEKTSSHGVRSVSHGQIGISSPAPRASVADIGTTKRRLDDGAVALFDWGGRPWGGGIALFALPIELDRRRSCYNASKAARVDAATRIECESPPEQWAAAPLRPSH